MKRAICLAALCGLGGFLLASCGSSEEGYDEGVGSIEQDVSKCSGGKLGASNFCSAACKCNAGEGDCDSDSECNAPAVCSGDLSFFGAGLAGNACAPAHCKNKVKDADETQIDCGNSCGTICPNACAGITANGTNGHCTTDCPCPPKEGDCNLASNKCQAGLTCVYNTGASVGLAAAVDLCLGANCSDGIKNGFETAIDCGGTQCLPCSGGSVQSADYGGTLNDHGLGVGVDSSGNVIVGGRYSGTATFGGADLVSNAATADLFVAKYNNGGVFVKSVGFGSDGPDGDQGVSLAVDGAGNSYIAANFYAGHNITMGATTLTSAGLSDILIAKLDTNLNVVWAKKFGGIGTDRALGIGLVGTDLFVVGSFQNSITFTSTHNSLGSSDAFVVKLTTAAGAVSWSAAGGGTSADQAFGVGVDSLGSPYIAGSFAGTASFGSTMLTSVGGTDAFMARLSSAGAYVFAKGFGGTGNDSAQSVVLDANREPTVVGSFRQTVDFGDAAPVAAVGIDAFAVHYSNTGTFGWKSVISSSDNDDAVAGLLSSSGNITVLGSFQGNITFGANMYAPAAGSRAMYIATLNRTTGALISGVGYGAPGGARPWAAARSGTVLTVTGEATGSVNLGGSNLMNKGLIDMFLGRFAN